MTTQTKELVTCPACWGSGFEPGNVEDETGCVDACIACDGTGSVFWPLARIYDAGREILRSDPQWWAKETSNFDHPGISLYSLADWLRRRTQYRPVLRVEGRRRFDGTALVNVKAGARNFVMAGLEWGYLGEGPRGLAAVLGDCFPDRFPTQADAELYVMGLFRDIPWRIP